MWFENVDRASTHHAEKHHVERSNRFDRSWFLLPAPSLTGRAAAPLRQVIAASNGASDAVAAWASETVFRRL
jgi:hypothetical protein